MDTIDSEYVKQLEEKSARDSTYIKELESTIESQASKIAELEKANEPTNVAGEHSAINGSGVLSAGSIFYSTAGVSVSTGYNNICIGRSADYDRDNVIVTKRDMDYKIKEVTEDMLSRFDVAFKIMKSKKNAKNVIFKEIERLAAKIEE